MPPRAPRPEDLYDLRVPVDLELSPDGRQVAFAVKAVAPGKDGYRTSLWIAPADGSSPARQLTVGARNDTQPRWSPDGRSLAFISDRGAVLQAGGGGAKPGKAEAPKEGGSQVWLLPFADGGEARQLTDLPKDVEGLAWSPDGRRLAIVSTAASAEPERKPDRKPDDPPAPDTRLIDRLGYQFNGAGFVNERFTRLWTADVATGSAELLTRGDHHDADPQWSPDGRHIAFVSDRHPNPDLGWRSDIYVVGASGGAVRQVSPGRGRQAWGGPSWSPDGKSIAAIGNRDWKRGVLPQPSLWRIRVRDGHADDLLAEADLDTTPGMNSDLVGAQVGRPRWTADGRWVVFAAPVEGSLELWRVEADGGRVERLTRGHQFLARQHLVPLPRGGARVAVVRTTATTPPNVAVGDIPAGRVSGT
ncbi:MAG: PD40 domain-containing protein, partial [Chloroflexi bacterium]|nr:PD40 domain-containing protein [Chloroflexota bacterium]